MPGKIGGPQRQIEQSTGRYLRALETANRTQPAGVQAETERLQDKIESLNKQMRRMNEIKQQLDQELDHQLSTPDSDSRSMIS